jgi:hypothetical protein
MFTLAFDFSSYLIALLLLCSYIVDYFEPKTDTHTCLCIGYPQPNLVDEPMYLTFIYLYHFEGKSNWHASVNIHHNPKYLVLFSS